MSKSRNFGIFLKKFKNIQEAFLNYLEDDENNEANFGKFKELFENSKIRDNKHDFRLFLHFLLNVANDRHRYLHFFSKIERILQDFSDDLKKYKNTEIFRIFGSNKRLLLLLIEAKILPVDEYFVKQISNEKYSTEKYPQYFAPEIKSLMKEEWFPKFIKQISKEKYSANKYPQDFAPGIQNFKSLFSNFDPEKENLKKNEWVEEIKNELPDNFYEMRKIGENESYLCKLIREDLVEDFITHVNKFNIKRNSTIPQSIYETNSFLIKKQEETTLIEYAAFFGSIQIFTFLKFEGVKLTPSLWYCSIHGKNPELIHLLEENHVELTTDKEKEKIYKGCFKESIKCHHNEFAQYFLSNFLQNEYESSSEAVTQSLEYYNFAFLQKEQINETSFCYLCNYDYYSLAHNLLTSRNVDINSKTKQAKTALYLAVEKENIEIVKLLLTNDKLDINLGYILNIFFIKFKIISFNKIQNHIFQ